MIGADSDGADAGRFRCLHIVHRVADVDGLADVVAHYEIFYLIGGGFGGEFGAVVLADDLLKVIGESVFPNRLEFASGAAGDDEKSVTLFHDRQKILGHHEGFGFRGEV